MTSTTPEPTDPTEDTVLSALTDVIRGATTPEIQEAQAMLLRRLAVEGDVIPSRMDAPDNVTKVGGYFNLLTDLAMTDMRRQMLGSVLGLASDVSIPPAGGSTPPMRFTTFANDVPPGPEGTTVAPTVAVRSDLAAPVQAAIATLHTEGGLLPLWSPPTALPPGPGGPVTAPDPMPYLGRALWVAPTVAMVDPDTDPIVLGRASTDPGTDYRIGVRVSAGTVGAPTVDWIGLVWDSVGGAFVERDLGTVTMLAIEDALTGTAFAAHHSAAAPSSQGALAWARLVAVGGLVPGASKLGDELALLWSADEIAQSIYSTHLDALWDGTTFTG